VCLQTVELVRGIINQSSIAQGNTQGEQGAVAPVHYWWDGTLAKHFKAQNRGAVVEVRVM